MSKVFHVGCGRRRLAIAAAFVATFATAAGCASGSSGGGNHQAGGTPLHGGDASIYNIGGGPNYIFPIPPANLLTATNIDDLTELLWRPLYWTGIGNNPVIDYSRSIGQKPVYSDNGKVVTIKLNHFEWSDGTPVTARDIVFWQNLIAANKDNWGGYQPGDYPDNIAKTTAVNPTTIQFTLTKPFDTNYFTLNQLTDIVPLPQQSWDKESATGKVGNYDETPAGAKAVFNYLTSQSKITKTYATNPLWQTVDGPWKLSTYESSNQDLSMTPNPDWVGQKPYLASFSEKNFTSTQSEFNALSAGNGPDVGYISPVELHSQPQLDSEGYTQVRTYSYATFWLDLNYNNPTVGPLFKQLYIRQAMTYLQDQAGIAKHYYDNLETPQCGPIPQVPGNTYVDSYVSSCPYSYNPAKAIALLKAHGWDVKPMGVSTCAKPGTAADECGAGITSGEPLKFTFQYQNEGIAYPKAIAQEKSDAEAAGIEYDLNGVDPQTDYDTTIPCKPSQSACKWEISDAGGIGYSPYPTGDGIFETGGGFNSGSYSDKKADALIKASTLPGNSTATLNAYQDYIAQQVPVIFEPSGIGLDEVKTNLHGVTPFNIIGNITPEDWYWTGSIPKSNS